jgi:hypothetical protein
VLPTSAESSSFPFAQSIVRSRTTSLDKEMRESQTREWISSVKSAEALPERFGRLVRGHWGIENGNHYRRDTLWREDHQRMKHHGRAHVLAILRELALWMHCGGAVTRLCSGAFGVSSPTSHQAKRFSHRAGAAIPLIRKDPRE